MKRAVSITRLLGAVVLLAATAAHADDNVTLPHRKKPAAPREEPKYQLDFSDAPTSNAPAPPPGTSLLRRDPDSGIPFLGLKLSKPLGN